MFGYVLPDEDNIPQHPSTRTDGLRNRIKNYNWVRTNLGIVGTEAACDWTIPYVDFSSPLNARNGITRPLWDLGSRFDPTEENLILINRMSQLNKRLAFTEMIKHEFLDANYHKERFVFADGTTITVDWDKKTVEIIPGLK